MNAERPKRQGIMLCYPFEEKRLAKWEPPYIVQPKLDGERCRLILTDSNRCLLLSSTEEIITSVPHINELAPRVLPPGEYDGELYLHGKTFEEIHSIVSRSVNIHPEFETMQFHCFDVITPQPQFERSLDLMALAEQLGDQAVFQVVPSYLCHDFDDIMTARTGFVTQGYEGIIVRHHANSYVRKRSTFMMKFKPKKSDAYLITGTVEELDKHGNPKNRLGALVCRGDDGTEFRVGSGFTAAQREALWQTRETLPGMFVKVEYQAMTPGRGVPRFPIFCSIIDDELAALVEQHRNLR